MQLAHYVWPGKCWQDIKFDIDKVFKKKKDVAKTQVVLNCKSAGIKSI